MNQSLGLWLVCHCKFEYYYYTVSHTDGITLEYTFINTKGIQKVMQKNFVMALHVDALVV